MNIKDMINKVSEMDSKDLTLLIECGIIMSKLKEEEQDKLMELIDLIIESQKKKFEKDIQAHESEMEGSR